jgi:hypothetical protein
MTLLVGSLGTSESFFLSIISMEILGSVGCTMRAIITLSYSWMAECPSANHRSEKLAVEIYKLRWGLSRREFELAPSVSILACQKFVGPEVPPVSERWNPDGVESLSAWYIFKGQ